MRAVPSSLDPVSVWMEHSNEYSTLNIDARIIQGHQHLSKRSFLPLIVMIGKSNCLADKNLEKEILIHKNKDINFGSVD